MLKQLWTTGILAAFLIFGIKTGLGMGAQLFNPSLSKRIKWKFAAGCLLSYVILFSGIYFLVTGFNLLDYLDRIARLMKYGMVLHFMLACGMAFWGTKLLLSAPNRALDFSLKAGILLIIPCPVCATVILLNLSLAYMLFPMPPLWTTLLLWGLFSSIVIITSGLVFLYSQHIGSIDSFLGISMIGVALYFLLTMLIAPVYPKLAPAYAMALSNNPFQGMNRHHILILTMTMLCFGGLGFFISYSNKDILPNKGTIK